MPIYEFECGKCHCRFEKLVIGGDRENPECPDCGCRGTNKLMSAGCVRTRGAHSAGSDNFRPSSCAPKG